MVREAQLWKDIQDIIGNASLWPLNIRRLFWTKCVKHFDRIKLVTFCFVNGLHPDILLEWSQLKGLCRDENAFRHFKYLFTTFESGVYFRGLFAYNITMQRYEFLNGTVRRY